MNDRDHERDHQDRAAELEAFGTMGQDELEAMVPDHLIEQSWPRLAAEIVARPRRSRRSTFTSLAMAAALTLMIAVSGWLALENQRLRRSPEELVNLVAVAAPRSVTAGELAARLSLLPPETVVLSSDEVVQLFRRDRPLLHALMRGPRLDALVEDGVTAEEAITVLQRLDRRTPIRLGSLPGQQSTKRS